MLNYHNYHINKHVFDTLDESVIVEIKNKLTQQRSEIETMSKGVKGLKQPTEDKNSKEDLPKLGKKLAVGMFKIGLAAGAIIASGGGLIIATNIAALSAVVESESSRRLTQIERVDKDFKKLVTNVKQATFNIKDDGVIKEMYKFNYFAPLFVPMFAVSHYYDEYMTSESTMDELKKETLEVVDILSANPKDGNIKEKAEKFKKYNEGKVAEIKELHNLYRQLYCYENNITTCTLTDVDNKEIIGKYNPELEGAAKNNKIKELEKEIIIKRYELSKMFKVEISVYNRAMVAWPTKPELAKKITPEIEEKLKSNISNLQKAAARNPGKLSAFLAMDALFLAYTGEELIYHFTKQLGWLLFGPAAQDTDLNSRNNAVDAAATGTAASGAVASEGSNAETTQETKSGLELLYDEYMPGFLTGLFSSDGPIGSIASTLIPSSDAIKGGFALMVNNMPLSPSFLSPPFSTIASGLFAATFSGGISLFPAIVYKAHKIYDAGKLILNWHIYLQTTKSN